MSNSNVDAVGNVIDEVSNSAVDTECLVEAKTSNSAVDTACLVEDKIHSKFYFRNNLIYHRIPIKVHYSFVILSR